jgi:cbb3-type cytochrome oxidase subunit 3
MAENENSKGKVAKGVGVIGALITIVSVWWFALRPRKKNRNN